MYLNWALKLKNKKILIFIYKKFKFPLITLIINKIWAVNSIFLPHIYFIKAVKIKSALNLIIVLKKNKLKKEFKLKKIKFRRKLKKFYFRKKIKLSLKFCIIDSLQNKKSKILNILYFLKYFSIFRKRDSKIFKLARLKAKLSKKSFFKKKFLAKKFYIYLFKSLKVKKLKIKKYVNLCNSGLYFKQWEKFDRLLRLYDIKKKYIRYLNNNRSIYKLNKFRCKHNFKFIKRHIRSISALSIKSRIHMFELSLRNIIIKLKYAYTYRNSSLFIKSGYVFLNGKQNLNPFDFVYRGDLIELIYSKFIFKLKYKIRKKINISMRKYKKYNWRMLKNKIAYDIRKVRIYRFADKVFSYRNKMSNLFQTDFRTLSFFIVRELNYKKDLSHLNKKLLPLYMLKLFNWKVIS